MSTTIAKPQIEIDNAIKELIKHQTERCVIVHCRFFSEEFMRGKNLAYHLFNSGYK